MENNHRLCRTRSIALDHNWHYVFVMSPRLGDSLLSMVIVHNLLRHGYRIDVVSDQIYALRRWFPNVRVIPAPQLGEATQFLSAFDMILHAYQADKMSNAPDVAKKSIVLDELPVYRQIKNMVDIQVDVCRYHFGLANTVRTNGMRKNIGPRKRLQTQVLIHPLASDKQKSWVPMRFVRLALQLRKLGFESEFLVLPSELDNWKWLEGYGLRVCAYPSLDAVAARIIKSGWVIGNDSGIGHLASSLGIPTVSLAMRPSIAKRWQPGWAPSRVIIPPPVLPGRWLKEKSWKYLVSPSRVLAGFEALRLDCCCR